VFFITRAQLVAQDTDQLVDLYDARAPHVPGEMVGASVTSSSACAGEDCRMPSPVAPALGTPASALFVGSGNAVALPAPATHPKPKAKKKKSKRSRKKGKSRKGKTRGKSKRHRALRAAGTAGAAAGRSGRGAS
jgi:hypothetical protein